MMFPDEWQSLLVNLAVGVWRLRKRLESAEGGTRADGRRALRDVETIWDVLTQAGIEIQDHNGAEFDPGQKLKVLAVQPTAGLPSDQVLETVKPTIYYRGTWLQMGEVIVGTPQHATRDEAIVDEGKVPF
jgi:hypothetical protein